MDFDAEQIELARRLHHENGLLRFQRQDASCLEFEAGRFNLVVSQHVFHHIAAWQKVVREIARVLSDDLEFTGPFYHFNSAAEYIDALIADPPRGMKYRVTDIFENENAVCVIYRFTKGETGCPMCQVFYFDADEKICRIELIFDTGNF